MPQAIAVRRHSISGAVAGFALATMLVIPSIAQAVPFGSRTLRQGNKGPDVRTLQKDLSMTGYRVRANANFGPRTARAVRSFERAHRLRIDGVVTPADAKKIQAAMVRSFSGGLTTDAPVFDPNDPMPVAGDKAVLNRDGTASPPVNAPAAVRRAIIAANRIAKLPYRYGGGHASFKDTAYDCSGSVSYALHGGGLLNSTMASGDFESWGASGSGRWITTYANGGHMYMTIAGLRFDTSGANPSRWQKDSRSSAGYVVRHPVGY